MTCGKRNQRPSETASHRADEKHTSLGKKRVYVPTTVAQGCFLGVGLTESASAQALTAG
ncbi:MAG: hypothetical protein QNJ41_29375 [Xenococcaceae cyanobacterium MO_188.B32]|nr:hypothetical protein [Xenococcaceae cyanobacterium MO_188.B32]